MDWSKEKILSTVRELREDYLYMSEKDIEKKYADFKKDLGSLYLMVLTPTFNETILINLLEYRDKAKRENIPDMVRDVSVAEAISKKYLYPVVGEPSLADKKKAAKIIAKKYNK